ncbi:MAG TPA: Uma2 family endonuclease [Tepidisphaeraceae bacterium]
MSQPKYVSREDYLESEQTAVEKHEWINGVVVEMQGGTYRNSRTNANLIGSLGNTLDNSSYFVLESNMRLWMREANRYTYPDAQIVCGEPAFDPADRRQTTITNPTIVFEVLSDSTEANDRGPKFRGYIAMPTVQAYVLVSTREPRVEWYVRQPGGAWLFNHATGLESFFTLAEPAVTLLLRELYVGVTFDPPPDPNAPRNEEPL